MCTNAAQDGCREERREAVFIVSIITPYVCVCVMDTEYLNNACYLQECVLLVPALMEGSALRQVISYASVQKGLRERAANTVSLLCLLKGLKLFIFSMFKNGFCGHTVFSLICFRSAAWVRLFVFMHLYIRVLGLYF